MLEHAPFEESKPAVKAPKPNRIRKTAINVCTYGFAMVAATGLSKCHSSFNSVGNNTHNEILDNLRTDLLDQYKDVLVEESKNPTNRFTTTSVRKNPKTGEVSIFLPPASAKGESLQEIVETLTVLKENGESEFLDTPNQFKVLDTDPDWYSNEIVVIPLSSLRADDDFNKAARAIQAAEKHAKRNVPASVKKSDAYRIERDKSGRLLLKLDKDGDRRSMQPLGFE